MSEAVMASGGGGAPAPARRPPGQAAETLPEDRFGVLGVDVSLRTDNASVRGFFRHAYRWFPAASAGVGLPLAAVFGPNDAGFPFAAAGDSWIDLSRTSSPENRAFLFLIESLMDRIGGCVMIHGAAVRAGAEGVILAGPALAGKSTLVLELMKLGHAFLSDDAAPIDRSSGRLLPFPRSIGVRKPGPAGGAPPALPPEGVLELPHKWLVDPAAAGAVLPAASCRPGWLFYLEPETPEPAASRSPRVFDLALADGAAAVLSDLVALGAEKVEEVPGRPFTTLAARFSGGSSPHHGLTALWRRHRGAILYVEEVRNPPLRMQGEPSIRRAGLASLLLPLVRDVLNRAEGGALMTSHAGRLTSLVTEVGALLHDVRCHRVTPGSPAATAAAVDRIVRDERVTS